MAKLRMCNKEGCNNVIPRKYIDENGKEHYLHRRRYCFDCSPFGEHNTKNFDKKKKNKNKNIDKSTRKECFNCGGYIQKGKNSSICHTCYFHKRKIRKRDSIYGIIGTDCWFCGYDKGMEVTSILEFHHINPDNKIFNISSENMVGKKWDDVFNELQKCVSLCCRCHREYHAGIISDEGLNKVYQDRWKEIHNNKDKQKLIEEESNRQRHKKKDVNKEKSKKYICKSCGKKTANEYFCSNKCRAFHYRKCERPPLLNLLIDINELGYLGTGRKYGVSDNAIRKWIGKKK